MAGEVIVLFYDLIRDLASSKAAFDVAAQVHERNLANKDTDGFSAQVPILRCWTSNKAVANGERAAKRRFPRREAISRPADGCPVDEEGTSSRVVVVGIKPSLSPLVKKHDPDNPQADAEGYILQSNVKMATEVVQVERYRGDVQLVVQMMQAAMKHANECVELAGRG
ncbi:MAG: hypothetical protein LBJ38_02430 [Oscillospiraceae bacterium]|jgi:flagellar basal-body rod protein FlgC|nr:hypothetical protein [Oscillospiraceae bacterium]